MTRTLALACMLALGACTSTLKLDLGGSSSSYPVPVYGTPRQQAPAPETTTTAPSSDSADSERELEAPVATARPAARSPERSALRKRTSTATAQVEVLMTKLIAAVSKANGNCKRAFANLGALEPFASKVRVAVDKLHSDAEEDAALADEWAVALATLKGRLEPRMATWEEKLGRCKDDDNVQMALMVLRPRVFKVHRAGD